MQKKVGKFSRILLAGGILFTQVGILDYSATKVYAVTNDEQGKFIVHMDKQEIKVDESVVLKVTNTNKNDNYIEIKLSDDQVFNEEATKKMNEKNKALHKISVTTNRSVKIEKNEQSDYIGDIYIAIQVKKAGDYKFAPTVKHEEQEKKIETPVLKVVKKEEQTTPKIEKPEAKVEMPKPEEVKPEAKVEMPKPEEVKPEVKEEQPKPEEVKPEVKEEQPKPEEVKQEVKEEQPKPEEVKPKVETEQSKQEEPDKDAEIPQNLQKYFAPSYSEFSKPSPLQPFADQGKIQLFSGKVDVFLDGVYGQLKLNPQMELSTINGKPAYRYMGTPEKTRYIDYENGIPKVAVYKNAGTYKGKPIGLRATISNFDKKGNIDQFYLNDRGFAVSVGSGLRSVDIKLEFIDASTNQKINNAKGYYTFADIDNSEGITLKKSLTVGNNIFLQKNSHVHMLEDETTYSFYQPSIYNKDVSDKDINAMATVIFDTSFNDGAFEYTFYNPLGSITTFSPLDAINLVKLPELEVKDVIYIEKGTTFNPNDAGSKKLVDLKLIDSDGRNITAANDKYITSVGTVDSSKAGENIVTYIFTDPKYKKEIKKEVKVIVKDKPFINAENRTLKKGTEFNAMQDVTAVDGDGKNITNRVKVISNPVDINKPGEYKVLYEVTDEFGFTTQKEIIVKVTEGTLQLIDVPKEISFGDLTIPSKPTTYAPKFISNPLKVIDERDQKQKWSVYVKEIMPLTSAQNDKLTGALIYKQNGKDTTLSTSNIEAFSYTSKNDEEVALNWKENEGVHLQVKPGPNVKANTTYAGKLEWTLTDAPL